MYATSWKSLAVKNIAKTLRADLKMNLAEEVSPIFSALDAIMDYFRPQMLIKFGASNSRNSRPWPKFRSFLFKFAGVYRECKMV